MRIARYTNPDTSSSEIAFVCHGKLYDLAEVERALSGQTFDIKDIDNHWEALVAHIFTDLERYEGYYKRSLAKTRRYPTLPHAMHQASVTSRPFLIRTSCCA